MNPQTSAIRGRNRDPRQVRISSILLIVAGLFLSGLGLALVAYLLDYISLSDIFPETYRDPNAEPVETPIGAYIFIGFILFFGLVSLAEGGWRVCFAEHHRHLMIIMLVLGGIFFVAGALVEILPH